MNGFEKNTAGLSSKLAMLKQKQSLQNTAVEQYRRALDTANGKVEKTAKTHEKLAAELGEAKKQQAALKTQVDDMKVSYKECTDAADGDTAAAALLSEKIAELEGRHDEARKHVEELEGKFKSNSKAMRNAANNATDYAAKLNNAEAELKEISAEIETTSTALYRMESLWGRAESALSSYAKSADKVGNATEKVGKKLTKSVTAPIVAVGTYALKAEVEFESAFAGVRKTTNATEEEFAALEQSIKSMSLEIPSTTTDLAGVMEIAGQLGILKENLADYTRTIVDLDNTTNLSAEDAATQIAQFANVAGMKQEEVSNFGSALVDLGNNFATTESDILNMATRLASAGSQVGLSEAQILGFATALSSVGLEAEAGGTAFSKAMKTIQLAVETGDKSLEDFAKIAGMTVDSFAAMWESNPAEALQSFIVGLSSMSEEGVSAIAVLDEIGFSEVRLSDTLLRATNASELFAKAQTTATSAWEENTALAAEASVRYETMESNLQILKNHVTQAAQALGTEMVPMAKNVISTVTTLIDKFMALDTRQKEQIVKWGAIAAAAGPVLTVLGKIVSISGKTSTAIVTIGKGLASLGGANLGAIGAATLGITALIVGLDALADMTPTYEQALDKLFDDVDEEKLGKFNEAYQTTLKADVKVEPNNVEVTSLYDEIETALTDGMPDTPEIVSGLENKVRSYYATQVENVNKWVNEEIAKLDVNSETYDTDVANIKAKGAELVTELQTQQDATIEFIDSAAGKSTAAVQVRLGELDAIEQRAQEVTAEIEAATKAAKSEGEQASNVVKSGVSMNEETAGRAFGYARQTYESQMGELQAQYEADLKKLESLGATAYEAGIEDLESNFAAQKDAVMAAYQNELSALLNGLGAAFEKANPELAAKMREAAEKIDLKQQATAIYDRLVEAAEGDRFAATDFSEELVAAMGFGNAEEMASAFNNVLDGVNFDERTDITSKIGEWSDQIKALADEDLGGEDFGGLSTIFQGLLEGGITAGIDGIDLTSNEGKMKALFTDIGAEIRAGVKAGIESSNDVSDATISMADDAIETARNGWGIHSPSTVFYGMGQDIVQGLVNGINSKKPAAIAAARMLAQAVNNAVKTTLDINSPSKVFEKIGVNVGEGLVLGLENERTLNAVKKASSYLAGAATSSAQTTAARGVTDSRNQSVNVSIENYNATSEQDVDTLARSISSMTRRRNRGYGVSG